MFTTIISCMESLVCPGNNPFSQSQRTHLELIQASIDDPPVAPMEPRRSPSLSTCRNVAHRWGLSLSDAAEICRSFEEAQSRRSSVGSENDSAVEDLQFL